MADNVTFNDFKKMDLRVGKILEVSPHPNADKLLVLKVDIGGEQRQVVAGLKGHYEPDALAGKLVPVLVNLEPKPLRGIESQGMVLAATAGDSVVVLSVDREVPAGSRIS